MRCYTLVYKTMISTSTIQNKKPIPILIASVFIVVCSIALVVFALAMIFANYGSHPSPNTANLTQSNKQGLLGLAVFIMVAALVMIYGVYIMIVNGQRTLLFILLGIPLAIGCVGETIDAFGTATLASDAIGAGILLLFAIPIILLLLPNSRNWSKR